jgi:hypothetical protein
MGQFYSLLFSGGEKATDFKSENTICVKDPAILGLKTQRDKLKLYNPRKVNIILIISYYIISS